MPIHNAATVLQRDLRFKPCLDMLEPARNRKAVTPLNQPVAQRFDARYRDRDRGAQRARRQACRYLKIAGSAAAAGAEHDRHTQPCQSFNQIRIEDRQRRYDDHLVAVEWRVMRQDIDINPKPAQRRIKGKNQLYISETAPLRLRLEQPGGFVGKEQRDGFGRFAEITQNCQIAGGCARLMRADIVDAVGAEQPGMMHFLRERGLPPTEIADQFGTMRRCFKRPEPDHASERRGVVRGPVHRAGLLLHHPPAALGAAAIEIMVKGSNVRVPLTGVAQLVVATEPELLEKANRIAVPGRHIEIARDSVVIKFGEEAHIIVDDVAARRARAQDVHL